MVQIYNMCMQVSCVLHRTEPDVKVVQLQLRKY